MSVDQKQLIRNRAEQEAANFTLPSNWQVGRAVLTGYAIDAATSPDIDDALALTRHSSGHTLHVSIADTGTFLYDKPDIVARALQEMRTRYYGNTIIRPMIPACLSEDLLSLVDGQERPVVTGHIAINKRGVASNLTLSHGNITARRITYHDVNQAIGDPEDVADGEPLRRLFTVASGLFRARHDTKHQHLAAEDEDGLATGERRVTPGQIIVQESMIALGAMMARYAQEHNIPILYRGHHGRAFYTVTPHAHRGLGLEQYAHITSPLRRISDFMNQANVSAFLENREYPFPEEMLADIADRIAQQDVPRSQRSSKPFGQSQEKRRRHASDIAARIDSGAATQNDFVDAFFGDLRGTSDQLNALDKKAITHVAKNIYLSKAVLNEAVARGLIEITPVKPDNPNNMRRRLTDKFDNQYTFKEHPRGSVSASMAYTRLLSQIVDIPVEPELPAHLTEEGRILADGDNYLRGLSGKRQLQYRVGEPATANDGTVDIEVAVYVRGQNHIRMGRGNTSGQAIRDATRQLITELDLIKNPPDVRPHIQIAAEREALAATIPGNEPIDVKLNPIVRLQKLLSKRGLPAVNCTFGDAGDGDGIIRRRCTLRVLDNEGKEAHRVEVVDSSNKIAKQAAAKWLFDQLSLTK